MAAKFFLFRRGDGNEGNFPRYILRLEPGQCPYDALRACLASEYQTRGPRMVRRYIMKNVEVEGEAEFGLSATVYEGPDGEKAFDAAWLTAELQPLSDADVTFYKECATSEYSLRQALDNAAWRYFRKLARQV